MAEVIFLLIIVSFTAIIFLNGATLLNSSNSSLRLTAINLANEQFAELERLAAAGNLSAGSYSFLGAADDLKNFGLYKDSDLAEKNPTAFQVSSAVKNYSAQENLYSATVLVSWTYAGKNYRLEAEKILRVKPAD